MQEVSNCTCGSIGADQQVVRLSECHHRYWKGDRELTSVTSIIKQCWPIKKSWEDADPAQLEHARERGIRVDRYVSAFVTTGSLRIPAGEWLEVVELVQKFVTWWPVRPTEAQVILHDDEIAGTCDLIPRPRILDLKTVYNLDASYEIQLGAYADLYEKTFGEEPEGIAIVHLTKRFPKPVLVPLDLKQCREDWRALRSVWSMVQRRTNGGKNAK